MRKRRNPLRHPDHAVRSAHVVVRITEEDRSVLRNMAREQDTSVSELVRQVVHLIAVAWSVQGLRIKTAGEQLGEAIALGMKAARAAETQKPRRG
jgi:hypothetical protein